MTGWIIFGSIVLLILIVLWQSITVTFVYEKELDLKVKFLGFTVYDINAEPKKKKEKKQKKKKPVKEEQKSETAAVTEESTQADLPVGEKEEAKQDAPADNGKKANYIALDEIYNAMPELKNIGDILRLFPAEKIINGTHFDIENIHQVKSVIDVMPASMNLSSDKYTMKGVNIGYDRNAQVIITAPVCNE